MNNWRVVRGTRGMMRMRRRMMRRMVRRRVLGNHVNLLIRINSVTRMMRRRVLRANILVREGRVFVGYPLASLTWRLHCPCHHCRVGNVRMGHLEKQSSRDGIQDHGRRQAFVFH